MVYITNKFNLSKELLNVFEDELRITRIGSGFLSIAEHTPPLGYFIFLRGEAFQAVNIEALSFDPETCRNYVNKI